MLCFCIWHPTQKRKAIHKKEKQKEMERNHTKTQQKLASPKNFLLFTPPLPIGGGRIILAQLSSNHPPFTNQCPTLDVHVGVSTNGGTPSGWLTRENPYMDDSGGTPISGNLYVSILKHGQSGFEVWQVPGSFTARERRNAQSFHPVRSSLHKLSENVAGPLSEKADGSSYIPLLAVWKLSTI